MISKSTQLVLKRCRAFVGEQLRSTLECHCLLDQNLRPVRKTLSPAGKPFVERCERLLAGIARELAPRSKRRRVA